jgi:hypothetical protein
MGPGQDASIIGNMLAPPGMKTILKPKYFEAFEVPVGSIPLPKSVPKSH